jgi:hypothetical protein
MMQPTPSGHLKTTLSEPLAKMEPAGNPKVSPCPAVNEKKAVLRRRIAMMHKFEMFSPQFLDSPF